MQGHPDPYAHPHADGTQPWLGGGGGSHYKASHDAYSHSHPSPHSTPAASVYGTDTFSTTQGSGAHSHGAPSHSHGVAYNRAGPAGTGLSRTQFEATDAWITTMAQVSTVAAPDQKGRLENALDNMSMSGQPFLGRFQVLSAAHRRSGGQGVVQVLLKRSTAVLRRLPVLAARLAHARHRTGGL